jgi:uncharacterized Ntn-hydrolase superfamily protein
MGNQSRRHAAGLVDVHHPTGRVAAGHRPAHTYSIVARDPATGDIGVAVQSHWFSVGSVVPWVEAGVGGVATQSMADPSYGKLGLDLMRAGKSAPQALRALLAGDEGRELRQVAMVDAHGGVAAHTGRKNIPEAGHLIGEGYSVQANLMMNDRVWPQMAGAFESAQGDLAGRLLAALEAAQAAGGDIRGKQSAAMVVASRVNTGQPWNDRRFDLRVDDSPDPLKELRRLLDIQRAYHYMEAGDQAAEKDDYAGVMREYLQAEGLIPDNPEVFFWHAVALVNIGRIAEALPVFQNTFAMDENWRTLTPRLVSCELLPNDQELIDQILSLGNQ